MDKRSITDIKKIASRATGYDTIPHDLASSTIFRHATLQMEVFDKQVEIKKKELWDMEAKRNAQYEVMAMLLADALGQDKL